MSLRYLSADQLLADAQRLALLILEQGFHPDLLIALWRGGTPVAMAIHEVFVVAGFPCQHTVIGASSYTGIDQQRAVQVSGLELLSAQLQKASKVLVIDDVFDTGRTIAALRATLLAMKPALDFKVATPWFKPSRNATTLQPDFFLHSTDEWLVFPHELQGLNHSELLAKPGPQDLIERLAHIVKAP